MQAYVIEMPRLGRALHGGTPASCLEFIRSGTRPGAGRLALVLSAPPPDEGPDALACVPIPALDDWTDRAVDLVEAWDTKWLLIDSMPARHRDEARDDLWHAIGAALLVAATVGIDDCGAPGDLPF